MDEQKSNTEAQSPVAAAEPQPVAATPEPAAPETRSTEGATTARGNRFTIIAIVLVLVALTAVWYRLEAEGRVSTNVFSGLIEARQAAAPVATVNGEVLRGSDLQLSLEQLRQSALAQGQDPEDPETHALMREQAMDMLVNTTLLKQAAAEQGISIDDAAVQARIAEIETEAGGAEELQARLDEFEVSRETFAADIHTELLVTQLLESLFAETQTQPTDEDVQAVYDSVAANNTDVPPLEEVRDQIMQQLQQTQQQAIVGDYLEELRAAADITTES